MIMRVNDWAMASGVIVMSGCLNDALGVVEHPGVENLKDFHEARRWLLKRYGSQQLARMASVTFGGVYRDVTTCLMAAKMLPWAGKTMEVKE
jgi:hypothetical protein